MIKNKQVKFDDGTIILLVILVLFLLTAIGRAQGWW